MNNIIEIDFNFLKHIVDKIREGVYHSTNYEYNTGSQYVKIDCSVSAKSNFSFPSWMGEAPRANSPWTNEEETLVISNYKIGYSIAALASLTGRKETGILSRLEQKFPELKQVREATQKMKNIEKELNNLIERALKAKNLVHYKP